MARTRRQRLLWAIVFVALALAAVAAIVDPSDLAWSHGFMLQGSGANFVNGRPIAVGDHLQTTYYMWLWWHSLVSHSHLPVVDPFQFALTGHTTHTLFGWPLVLMFVPFTAVFGPVAAYNAVFVATFVAAAACMYIFCRALGLALPAATVAAFAYAFAPWRLVQAGHIGGLLGFLLPLTLYFAERALRGPGDPRVWGWACAAAYVSLVGSGELHLAMFGTILFVAFVIIRSIGAPADRRRALVLPAVTMILVSALGVGMIYHFELKPSGRNGISITAAKDYAPDLSSILNRTHNSERFAYPGLVTFVLALLGFVRMFRQRAGARIARLFGAFVLLPYFIALAPRWHATFQLYKLLPFIGFVRVPGRILVLAVFGLAILAGYGTTIFKEGRKGYFAMLVVLALLCLDSRGATASFEFTSAGQNVLAAVPKGAPVLDLPPFPPDSHAASRYMLDIMRNPGPRASGYYTLAPAPIYAAQHEVWQLAGVPVVGCRWKDLQNRFHFDYVAVHTDLFGGAPFWGQGNPGGSPVVTAAQLLGALDGASGFRRISVIDGTVVYKIVPSELRC